MSQIVKAGLGVILLVLLTAFSIMFIRLQCEVQAAQNFHDAVLDELENSFYNADVLAACKEQAKEYCYQLNVSFYEEENIAEVVLEYPFCLSACGIERTKTLVGYTN